MYTCKNAKNIRNIFEEKTGVKLQNDNSAAMLKRAVTLAAALVLCFLGAAAVSAFGMFSSLDGDDVAFNAIYEGDGIVSVTVENRSDKDIWFEHRLRLMRWSTSEEIESLNGKPTFEGTIIEANSSGVMTIDLNGAYDITALEQPLIDDWYYLVLTNNNFSFGQDWMCSVEFAECITTPNEAMQPMETDSTVINEMLAELQPYFENVKFELEDRNLLNSEYMQQVETLLEEFDGKVIPSVSPMLLPEEPSDDIVFDETFTADAQRTLTGLHWHSLDWNFKMLAAADESALVLSAMLPLKGYEDVFRDMPLFYIFAYEKENVTDDSYAFIYGQMLTFAQMEKYKIYEDDQYICYEVHELIYSDLYEHTQRFLSYNPDIRFDDSVWARVENIYDYYSNNLKLYYVEY